MKNHLLQKSFFLAVIALFLLIPLSLIERTIEERTARRAEAVRAISAGSAGEQSISGPVMIVQVEEEYDDWQSGADRKLVRGKRLHKLTVLPHALHLEGSLNVEKRAYGLHETAVFEMQGAIVGNFESPTAAQLPTLGPNARLTWGAPTLTVGVEDARGIAGEPKFEFAGKSLKLRQGNSAGGMKGGFHADAPDALSGRVESLPFRVDLRLSGTSTMGFVPVGAITTVTLKGNWPHPSFGGDFLPRSREVNANGFLAKWSMTGLAASAEINRANTSVRGFQVRLIEPVDVYRQSLRAVKYGILFVVLSFAAFFVFEYLKALPIHPIQYLMVGLAQAIFFLLLTSLSEHIAFSIAYVVATVSSIGLIGIYLTAILRGWKRSMAFTSALALLYAALFGILQSEQNALLLGSALLFLALSVLMLSTRRVDWYRVGNSDSQVADTTA